jgi:hypothetical protein
LNLLRGCERPSPHSGLFIPVMESPDKSLDGLPKRSVRGSEVRNHCLGAVTTKRSDERERRTFDVSFHLMST